jgi:hypothetical protein
MSNTQGMVCIMVCALFAAGMASAQSKVKKPAAEPTVFSDNEADYEDGPPDPFKQPVPLPNNVLDALRATAEAKEMQDELKNLDREEFARLFTAVRVHLGDPKDLDYVVRGEIPMSGADNTWYWIVRPNPTSAKVIFFTNSNGFALLKTRNNGYLNIRSGWCSAAFCITRIYHYNGQRYILAHEYHMENKP